MKSFLMKPWKAQAIHESSPETEWQTRRRIKPQPPTIWDTVEKAQLDRWCFFNGSDPDFHGYKKCPFSIRDKAYIRETFAQFSHRHVSNHDLYYPIHTHMPSYRDVIVIYRGSGADYPAHFYRDRMARWKPSIHMPAWAARTIVEVTDIRCQRIMDISEKDAEAEGVEALYEATEAGYIWDSRGYRRAFQMLWNSIHGPDAWTKNEWVFAYSLRRIER